MPSEAQEPCSKENESTLRGVAGGGGFLGLSGSVPRGSRRAYAQSRQRTSTSARTSSRRCLFPAPRATSSRKRTGRTRATALHPHAVAGGVGFLGLSGSVPGGSRRAFAQPRQRTSTSARTSSRRCSFAAPRATSSRKRTGRTRATALHPQAAWGSWVSLAQYPGALAAPTCSPVSAPAPVPEPVRAGARSRRHVPHHLENEQVERGQQLCTHTLSQAAWGSWVSLAQYPVCERGKGSDVPVCSTSSTSRGPD